MSYEFKYKIVRSGGWWIVVTELNNTLVQFRSTCRADCVSYVQFHTPEKEENENV